MIMKWGRKKPSSTSTSTSTSSTTTTTTTTTSSSSHSHLISHVFPLSWLSKFKQPSEKPGSKKKKKDIKVHERQRLSPRSSPRHCNYLKDRRLYNQDNDGFWRLSFGEDCDNKFAVPLPYCGNCKSNVTEMATKKRAQKGVEYDQPKDVPKEVIVQSKGKVAKEEILQKTYRRIMEATEELHKELDEVNGYRKSVEKEMSEIELLQVMQMIGKAEQKPIFADNRKHRKYVSERDYDDGNVNVVKTEWEQLKEAKIREVLSKNESQRKSVHISRELQVKGMSKQAKIRVRSPRTPSKTETCKVKAIEDMKKAKAKKKIKEIQQDDKAAALGSFAVVKCSNDPQQDFRNSMVEMIIEKRIKSPEDLEELLSCYLTLNADEYHDLIIKVFKQVWCELEQCYYN